MHRHPCNYCRINRLPVSRQKLARRAWRRSGYSSGSGEAHHHLITGLELAREYFLLRGASKFEITTDLSGGPEHWTWQWGASLKGSPTRSFRRPPDNFISRQHLQTLQELDNRVLSARRQPLKCLP